jgi:hypothetical protein
MPAGDSTAWTPNAHGLTAKSAAKSSGQHLFPIGLARGEFLPVDFVRQPEIAVTFSGLSADATIRATGDQRGYQLPALFRAIRFKHESIPDMHSSGLNNPGCASFATDFCGFL